MIDKTAFPAGEAVLLLWTTGPKYSTIYVLNYALLKEKIYMKLGIEMKMPVSVS